MDTNNNDVLSFNDTKQPSHWMLDYTGIEVCRWGEAPIDVYMTLPQGSLMKMFGVSLTWNDNFKEIEL